MGTGAGVMYDDVTGLLSFSTPAGVVQVVAQVASDVRSLEGAGAPTDGVTGAALAGIGSRYTNTTNGKLYLNGGTKATPAWKIVTSA